jgi:hypothetical protein
MVVGFFKVVPVEKREGYNFVSQIADALLEKLFFVWIRATTRSTMLWRPLISALRDGFNHNETAYQYGVIL